MKILSFCELYSPWIIFILSLILDIVGLILSKPIVKEVVAISCSFFIAGNIADIKKQEAKGGGIMKKTKISWLGFFIFIIGIILTLMSAKTLFD